MSPRRRKRFLFRGIALGVFTMRIVLPLIVASIVGNINIFRVINLAITDPINYAGILSASHIAIVGFGTTFLLLVPLNFFFDTEKRGHRL